jgi:hypothetical protein
MECRLGQVRGEDQTTTMGSFIWDQDLLTSKGEDIEEQ